MIQPKTLDRWLDINPQNGPLRRTETFITLPIFNQAVTWKGYSEIVIAFNFEGPNAFSFLSLSSLPVSPNYLLCVMWKDEYNNVYRYALWQSALAVIYFGLPLYTGQVIRNNFRLEVWSTNSSPAINTTAINFYTSAAGGQDYRYGVDTALVLSDAAVTNFQCANVIPPSPPVVATDYFNPAGILGFGGAFISWTPSQGTGSVNVALNTPTVASTVPVSLINTTSEIYVALSSGTTNLQNLYCIFSTNVNGAIIIAKADTTQLIDLELGKIGGVITLGTPLGNITLENAQIVGVSVTIAAGVLTITAFNQIGVILGTKSGATAPLSVSYLDVGLVDNLYEFIHTVAPINFSSYIHANYGTGFPLPLVFPTNSTPLPNTI